MRKRLIIICFSFLAFAALLTVGCVKPGNDDNSGSKIIITNIILPDVIETEVGTDVTIGLRGAANIKETDVFVFQSISQDSFECPISNLKEGSSVTITLNSGIVSGRYRVSIKSNGKNWFVGSTDVSIIVPLNFEPDKDTNVYGMVTCDNAPVPNVLISDGVEIVATDSRGIYQLKSQKKWQLVFMILPSGYEPVSDGILPEIHAKLDPSVSKVERKDFRLVKVDNDKFTLFLMGDMHLANRNGDISQFGEFARTLNNSISVCAGSCYGLTLGDMTWDLYWYSNKYEFPQYLQTMNQNFKGLTVFHTMGNHDNDMNSVGDFDKSFQYTRDIAPNYYSFNLGKAHFIVLDNIDYNSVGANNDGTGTDYRGQYVYDYTAEQMAWLSKDLSYVSKSTPVFISSHASAFYPSTATTFSERSNGSDSAGEVGTAGLISACSGYDVHFLSGHTHNMFNYRKTAAFEEFNAGSVCGTWWWSGKQTPGIHLSQDGCPGGYSVYEFNGSAYTRYYQSAGHDANYQFRAYDMNEVKKVVTPEAGGNNSKFTPLVDAVSAFASNTILINVWDYDPTWKVSVTENGKALSVKQAFTYDPLHIMAHSAPRSKATSSPNFITCKWYHFFTATASSATSTVTVSVTDRNGKTITETMTRPKAFTTDEYKNR